MFNIKIIATILLSLLSSRLIPHPPNFTILIALSFYVPVFLGTRYVLVILISYVLTDLFLGFHSYVFFTWGSIILIGFLSYFFSKNCLHRIFGVIGCATLFFFITNLGVWASGVYGYKFSDFLTCYILALPFFGQTLVSSIFFSGLIEILYKVFCIKFKKKYI